MSSLSDTSGGPALRWTRRLSLAEVRGVLEQMPVPALLFHSPQAKEAFANPAARLLLGWPPSRSPLIPVHTLMERVTLEDGRRIGKDAFPSARALREGMRTEGDVFRYCAPGVAPLHLSVHAAPLWDRARTIAGCVLTFTDVTHHVLMQDQLREAQAMAERANRAKSEFVANVSHEIRTPLSAILGFSELFQATELSETERAQAASIVLKNGHELANIIDQILDLSKVESGHLEVEKTSFDLAECVSELHDLLRLRAEQKGLAFTLDFSGLAHAFIHTDRMRLRQILTNLVGNAIKFTETGEVRLSVASARATACAPGSGEVLFHFDVCDTGIGMTQEQGEKIFLPFIQADVSIARRFGGSGLGLSLSSHLATLLGGEIRLVHSVPGQGTSFRLSVPTKATHCASTENSAEGTHFQDGPTPGAAGLQLVKPAMPDLSGLTVLVVDDSPESRLLVSRVLQFAHADVRALPDALDGLAVLQSIHVDAVLLDLEMPLMDGFEALALYRRQGCRCPIYAMTAHALVEARERTRSAGFDGHIGKPLRREELFEVLEKLPRPQRSEDGVA